MCTSYNSAILVLQLDKGSTKYLLSEQHMGLVDSHAIFALPFKKVCLEDFNRMGPNISNLASIWHTDLIRLPIEVVMKIRIPSHTVSLKANRVS